MKRVAAWTLMVLAGLLLAGCVTGGPTPVGQNRNPVLPGSDAAVLRAGDTVVIQLQSIPDPTRIEAQLDDAGAVSLRFIGRVSAQGLSPSQLAEKIRGAYIDGRYYPDIDVGVSIAARFVYLGGEVRRPGPVQWSHDLTLTQAIAAAGGFAIYAKENGVQVSRDAQTYTIDANLAQSQPAEDTRLLPGDTVFVPRSAF